MDNQEIFKKINRPDSKIDIERIVDGLVAFRKEYSGQMWLEVFLIEGINTSDEQIEKFAGAIKRIEPDKVQLNTAVRPTAESGIKMIEAEEMEKIAEKLGPSCEVVASFSPAKLTRHIESQAESVLSILKRRPCSVDDICSGLSVHKKEALKYISGLLDDGLIEKEEKGGVGYYKAL